MPPDMGWRSGCWEYRDTASAKRLVHARDYMSMRVSLAVVRVLLKQLPWGDHKATGSPRECSLACLLAASACSYFGDLNARKSSNA